jgi:capsular exopolysaccharide synthesis family protein
MTAKNLDGSLDGKEVAAKVAIKSDPGSDVVKITATDPDPDVAAELANAFAENYIDFRRTADRERVARALKPVTADFEHLPSEEQEGSAGQALQAEMNRLKALKATQTGNAELVQTATPPSSASSPKTFRNVAFGAIVGFIVGFGLAQLLQLFDKKLRTPQDFEAAHGGMPIVATLSTFKQPRRSEDRVTALLNANGEALRMVRAQLRYSIGDRAIRSILVTSANRGEGKTTTALGLAASAASDGEKALLIEADFHRPTLAKVLNLEPANGLSDALGGRVSQLADIQPQQVSVGDSDGGVSTPLHLIQAGSLGPVSARLLASEVMEALLKLWTAKYDLVVIDTPPILRVADPIPLVSRVDGVLLVGEANTTTRDDSVRLAKQLQGLEAPVVGMVLNRLSPRDGYAAYDSD